MDLEKTLKDAAYIAVGVGVLGFRAARDRRRELEKRLEEQAGELRSQFGKVADELEKRLEEQTAELRSQFGKVADELEERIEPLVEAVETSLDQVEERLPGQAREAVHSARTAAKDARKALRTRLIAEETEATNGAAA